MKRSPIQVNSDVKKKLERFKPKGVSWSVYLEKFTRKEVDVERKRIKFDSGLSGVGAKTMELDKKIAFCNEMKRDILEDDLFKKLIKLNKEIMGVAESWVSEEGVQLWKNKLVQIMSEFERK